MRNDRTPSRRRCQESCDETGIALITVLLLLVAVTIVGIAALTVTGMEGRLAGFTRSSEAASTSAESCLDTGMQVVLQTLDVDAGGALPAAFKDDQVPAGPVPAGNYNTLNGELLGQDNNNPDTPGGSPNLVLTVNNFTVTGDIDRLYVEPKAGTSQAFDEPQTGSTDIIYRIDCVSTNAATGTSSRITGVYACTFNADGCMRAL